LKQKIIICLWLVAGLTYARICDAQMIYDTLLLSELEVMAYKVDYTSATKKQIIDSMFAQNLDHADIGALLSSYTPVYIRSYGKGSLATASFRGTGANHTQVMWDDFRINSPMLGQTDFSLIPVSFFNRVELLYGGASLEKSEGGLGGNICLSTETFNHKNPKVYLTQSVGSFKTFSTAAGLNLGKKKFNSDTRLIFQSSENNFSYYNDAIAPPQDMKQRNASYRNGGFTQQFSFRPDDNQTFNIASWTQWNNRNIPPVMSKAEANENLKEYEKDFFSRNTISWTYRKNQSKLQLKAAWFYKDYGYHQELINNDGIVDTLINSENKTNGVFAKAIYSTSFIHGFTFSSGLNYDHDNVQTNNYVSVKKRNTLGAFGKVEKEFILRIKLSLLIRGQLTDEDVLPLMPLLGLNIRILKNHDFYFRSSLSRNYHLPTLNDLYWNPGGNENLLPEDGYELEAGINYFFSSRGNILFKTDLTAYVTKVNNWIQWIDSGMTYWSPQNVNKVFSRGIEFSTQLQGVVGRLNYIFFGQYAYTRTTNQSQQAIENGTDNQQMIYIPEHAANGYLKVSFDGYYIDWHLHFVGEQNTIGGQLPAFLLNDLSLGKDWQFGKSSLNIRMKVNNVFDIQYQSVSARAMPGRNYEIIIKYMLNK